MSNRVVVYQWKVSLCADPSLCPLVFALNRAGRVVEIETQQRGEDWWMILKAVVPLPRKVAAIISKGTSDDRKPDEVPAFQEFASISRLSRDMVVTEKLDGTNAQVCVLDDGRVLAGSRNRWITPEQDNFGFAAWVKAHEDALRSGLGVGSHYGEWWGAGIQRRYGLDHKRFSLFNVSRWHSPNNTLPKADGNTICDEVPCCHVVPVLLRWTFDTGRVDDCLSTLQRVGSAAALGFMQPEGVVVFHASSNTLFKKTLDKNDGHKGVKP